MCACVRIQFITDCLDYALVSRYSSCDRRIDINYLNFSDIRVEQFIISSFPYCLHKNNSIERENGSKASLGKLS